MINRFLLLVFSYLSKLEYNMMYILIIIKITYGLTKWLTIVVDGRLNGRIGLWKAEIGRQFARVDASCGEAVVGHAVAVVARQRARVFGL